MLTKEKKLEWLNIKGFSVDQEDDLWVVEDIFYKSGYYRTFLTEEGAISISYEALSYLDEEDVDLHPLVDKIDITTLNAVCYTIVIIGILVLGILAHLKV